MVDNGKYKKRDNGKNSESLDKRDYFMPSWWEDTFGGVGIAASPWEMGQLGYKVIERFAKERGWWGKKA